MCRAATGDTDEEEQRRLVETNMTKVINHCIACTTITTIINKDIVNGIVS